MIKKIIKTILPSAFVAWLINLRYKRLYGGKAPQEIFSEIYTANRWNDLESRSGSGSNLTQTKTIMAELPKIFKQYEIKTMLDIPCGDCYWMSRCDLSGINYLGADIVPEIIEENKKQYPHLRFQTLNILEDALPKVDLIFCRDCLVHFPFEKIKYALNNFVKSESTYLMTTTFPNHDKNRDIVMGHWRPLNLTTAPFNLPEPIFVLKENCTEENCADKSLGLWRIEDIKNFKNY